MEALNDPPRIKFPSSGVIIKETSVGILDNVDIIVENQEEFFLVSSPNAIHLLPDDSDDLMGHCIPPDSETSDFMELQDVSIIAADYDVSREPEFLSGVQIKKGVKRVDGGDYSSSSEGTMDNQESGQTYPETPPTPLSFESRASSQSSASSSRSGIVQTPSLSKGSELPPPILSIPLADYQNNPQSLKMSLSGNRLPDRVRRSRTEIMGRSIFSCFNGDSDTISPKSSFSSNREDVFRRRPGRKKKIVDSEEALEIAAQKIRNQLLLKEMVELAAKAERAADSGHDRFTGYPLCVFPNDLPSSDHRHSPAMRRSFSEGAYVPSPRRKMDNPSASLVVEREFIAPVTKSPIPEVRKLGAMKLRDINDVVPYFGTFHRHLRTHFFRNDVLHQQLLFHENQAPIPDSTKERSVWARSNSDDAMSLLPMCSNELTATPLPQVRKTVAISPPSIPPPIQGFLKHFRLDHPWSVPLDSPKPSIALPSHLDGGDTLDESAMDSLSEQVLKPPTSQIVPRKIDTLPGLEDQNFVPRTTVRLLPKVDRRSYFAGTDAASQQPFLNPDLSQSVMYMDFRAADSKALLDETECDSCDEYDTLHSDQFDSLGLIRSLPFVPPPNDLEDSLRSLLDDPFLALSPSMSNAYTHERKNSILLADEECNSIPVPPMIPDFVTPVRLRKIRGTSAVRSFVPSIVLPMPPTAVAEGASWPPTSCPNLSSFTPMTPLLDVSSDSVEEMVPSSFAARDSRCFENLRETNCKGLDLSVTTETTSKSSESTSMVPVCQIPGHSEDSLVTASLLNSTILDIPMETSLDDIDPHCSRNVTNNSVELRNVASVLPVLQMASSCHSFGDIALTPGNEDCGCLSMSPESPNINEMRMSRKEVITKSPSTGALDDLKSWNEFVEHFDKRDSNNAPRSSSVPRHSIREAMELFSSKLSPRKFNLHDPRRRALYARMKENEDFMSNFLYCSKPSDRDTTGETDDMPSASTKGGLSFLCIDGSMAGCGDTTDAVGYCCTTSWLEEALHLRWRPSANSSQPQSCLKLGRVNSSSAPHGNSWLDLAQMDGLDPWVGTNPIRTEPSGANVSFQAPSLKKMRNLRSSWNSKSNHSQKWVHEHASWEEDMSKTVETVV